MKAKLSPAASAELAERLAGIIPRAEVLAAEHGIRADGRWPYVFGAITTAIDALIAELREDEPDA